MSLDFDAPAIDVHGPAASLRNAVDILQADGPAGIAEATAAIVHGALCSRWCVVAVTAADGGQWTIGFDGLSAADAQAVAAETIRGGRLAGTTSTTTAVNAGGRHFGWLVVEPSAGSSLSDTDTAFAAAAADCAGLALHTAFAFSRTRRAEQTSRALLDFAQVLARSETTSEVADVLASKVLLTSSAQSCAVIRAGYEDSLILQVAYEVDDRGVPLPRRPKSTLPIDPDATPSLRQALVSSIPSWADQPDDLAELLGIAGGNIALVAQLRSADGPLGLVVAEFAPTLTSEQRATHAERVGAMAGQAAVALQNAQLIECVTHMAWHDTLTSLPNRRLLSDRVHQEILRSRRTGENFAMCFVDLDRFKHVNDTYGHAVGDDLIVAVANRLCEAVRSQDTVARLGGDEFAVLLPGIGDTGSVHSIAERIMHLLSAPYQIGEHTIHASGSIGVAVFPEHGETCDDLLRAADSAMYCSKQAGRGTFRIFTSSGSASADLRLEEDLRAAADAGLLTVHYQPFVALETGRVVGAEALIRWEHPEHGAIGPDRFIPLAEQSSLITTIDTLVVRKACADLGRFDRTDLRIAVNVHARDLADPAFVAAVKDALAANRIAPGRLELEVSERTIIAGDIIACHIGELHAHGVRFAVDDFGVGESSLSRLDSLPVSTIKIDRSFVSGSSDSGEMSSLVSAIVGIARQRGADCVVEGIESAEQLHLVRTQGCGVGQGFYFSPAAPASIFETMTVDGFASHVAASGNLPTP